MEQADANKELVEKIHQFFKHEIQNNTNLSEAAKETLTVASECIGQAYNIESKPASNELLTIYRKHKTPSDMFGNDQLNRMVQNLVTSFVPNSQTGASTANPAASTLAAAAAAAASNWQQASSAAGTTTAAPSAEPAKTKREQKSVSDAEKIAADSFKNQGNDHMRTGNYQDAYDSYTKAIDIDPNNAIYYSNRAAASSKLNKHNDALKDCKEAIEIDPTYGKAYGRLGLAYASLGDHKNSRDAYKKAVELEPDNEAHRDNLAIEEDLCNNPQSTTTAGTQAANDGQAGNDPMERFMSMLGGPNFMRMAMNAANDPTIQNVLSSMLAQTDPDRPRPPPGTS